MKTKVLRQIVSMLMVILMIVSTFISSAYAEELLPENRGEISGSADENVEAPVPVKEEQNPDLLQSETFSEEAEDEQSQKPVPDETKQTADSQPSSSDALLTDIASEDPAAEDETDVSGLQTAEAETSAESEILEESEEADLPEEILTENAEEAGETVVKQAAESESAANAVNLAVCIEATAVPHTHQHDPDEEAVFYKNHGVSQTVGDVIVKIGEGLIPFGNTISNFIRSRSNQAKDMDGAETAIDLAADTASFMCPIGAPLVSVAKDIALKIRRLFG